MEILYAPCCILHNLKLPNEIKQSKRRKGANSSQNKVKWTPIVKMPIRAGCKFSEVFPHHLTSKKDCALCTSTLSCTLMKQYSLSQCRMFCLLKCMPEVFCSVSGLGLFRSTCDALQLHMQSSPVTQGNHWLCAKIMKCFSRLRDPVCTHVCAAHTGNYMLVLSLYLMCLFLPVYLCLTLVVVLIYFFKSHTAEALWGYLQICSFSRLIIDVLRGY